jgi:hypothetical protein
MQASTRRKLLQYSAIAVAAGGASGAQSALITYDPNFTWDVDTETLFLDLDGGNWGTSSFGVPGFDFFFGAPFGYFQGSGRYYFDADAVAASSNFGLFNFTPSNSVSAAIPGDPYAGFWAFYAGDTGFLDATDGTRRAYGLRLGTGGGDFYYGWAHFELVSAADNTVLLDSIQWNDTPNTPVHVMPEPGPLAMSALASGYLLLYRRSRRRKKTEAKRQSA